MPLFLDRTLPLVWSTLAATASAAPGTHKPDRLDCLWLVYTWSIASRLRVAKGSREFIQVHCTLEHRPSSSRKSPSCMILHTALSAACGSLLPATALLLPLSSLHVLQSICPCTAESLSVLLADGFHRHDLFRCSKPGMGEVPFSQGKARNLRLGSRGHRRPLGSPS